MSIQLPSQFDANHIEMVHTLLKVAAEPDQPSAPGRRKAAEQAVQKCLFVPGFVPVVHAIFCNTKVAHNVRFVAIVCAKNAVSQHWGKTQRRVPFRRRGAAPSPPAPPPASEADKRQLKSALLQSVLRESDTLLARHGALLAALVVRAEVRGMGRSAGRSVGGGGGPSQAPQFWPDFFPTVMDGLRSESQDVVFNALQILFHAMDTFSKMKILVHKMLFQAQSARVLPALQQLFQTLASNLSTDMLSIQQLPGGTPPSFAVQKISGMRQRVKLCLFAAKTLRRCIVNGTPSFAESPAAHAYFSFVLPMLKQLNSSVVFLETISAKDEFRSVADVYRDTEKVLTTMAKTVAKAHKLNAKSFVPYLASFLNTFYAIAVGRFDRSDRECKIAERLQIQAILFVAEVVDNRFYHPRSSAQPTSAEEQQRRHLQQQAVAIIQAVLSPSSLKELLQIAIVGLMKLSRSDVDSWTHDGEVFVQFQSDMETSSSVRSAAEHLVLLIADRHPETVQGLMAHLLQGSSTWTLPTPDPSAGPSQMCLTFDAILTAFGVCFYQLQGTVQFAPWLAKVGLGYLQVASDKNAAGQPVAALDQRILQRRVLWLVKCCLYPLEPAAHGHLYRPILLALQSADFVVAVEAMSTLQAMIEDESKFQLQAFASNARGIVQALVANVFAPSTELATGEAVLQLLRDIVRRLGANAKHIASLILGPLPAIWKKCEHMNVLRPRVLEIVESMIGNLDGSDALAVVTKVVPLVKFALNPKSSEFHIVVGPGMALWKSIMRVAPRYIDFLHSLFPAIKHVLQFSLQHTFVAMGLVKSYVLLGGAQFLKSYAGEVASIIALIRHDSNDADIDLSVMNCISVVVTCFPRDAPVFLQAALAQLTQAILEKSGRIHVRLSFLSVLARVFATAPDALIALLGPLAQKIVSAQQGTDHKTVTASLFDKIVDEWLDGCDLIGNHRRMPLRQKEWALALCRVLGTNHESVVDKIPLILNSVSSIMMNQQGRELSNVQLQQYLVEREPGHHRTSVAVQPPPKPDCAEAQRWTAVLSRDFVYQSSILTELRKGIQQCVQNFGKPRIDAVLATVDSSTLSIIRGEASAPQ